MLTVVVAGPLRADDGRSSCLFVDAIAAPEAYSGNAVPEGSAPGGGILDRCAAFPVGGMPWSLSGGAGWPDDAWEAVRFNEVRDSFGFWVGAESDLALRFLLDGQVVHSTAWISLAPADGGSWWQWQGRFDEVEFLGAHPILLSGQAGAVDDWDEEALLFSELADLEQASTVPEPATLTLLATGLVGMAGAARRRREARRSGLNQSTDIG